MYAPICLARRHVWCGLAITLALLAVACGGGRHNQQAALPLAANTTKDAAPAAPSTPATLADALAQLDALAMPEGVSPELWSELKGKLREGLNDRYGGKGAAKITAKAPTGAENVVKWIFCDRDDEAGPAHLTWRYNNRGDYNLDGIVNVSDIVQLAMAFGTSTPDNPQYEFVDGNENGIVDIGDLTTLVMHFGNECTGYAVSMIKGSPSTWTQLTTIPLSHAPVIDGNRTYVLSCADWVQQSPDRFVVRPYDSTGAWGDYSIPAYALDRMPNNASQPIECIAGFTLDFNSADYGFSTVIRWEFAEGISPRFHNGPDPTITAGAPGDYTCFGISYYPGDESAAHRVVFNIHAMAVDSTPFDCRRISTPEGPVLYWPLRGYDYLVDSEVYRDGAYLATASPGSWFYLDDTCGMESHRYSVALKSGGRPIAASDSIIGSGSAFTNEHLYLLAEPQEITERTSISTLAVLVNNRHDISSIPSLRVWVRGQQTAGALSINETQVLAASILGKTASAAFRSNKGLGSLPFSIPYGTGSEVCAYPYVISTPDGVVNPPPNSTVLFCPFSVWIEPPISAATMLFPGTNEEGAFSFYMDSDENMYSFEFVHGISLTTFTPSSGIPSRPISGRLSPGIQPLPGDFNNDGMVSVSDVTNFAHAYMSTDPDVIQHNDQNGDGAVTIIDFIYMIKYYGTSL